jgi:hypothetical protein
MVEQNSSNFLCGLVILGYLKQFRANLVLIGIPGRMDQFHPQYGFRSLVVLG